MYGRRNKESIDFLTDSEIIFTTDIDSFDTKNERTDTHKYEILCRYLRKETDFENINLKPNLTLK